MDTPKNTVSYSYEIKVAEEHIDNLKHVNNVVYLQWVNDISEKHWNILAINGLKEKFSKFFNLKENESTFIPRGEIHRLENCGKEVLEIIEIQTGKYFGEDDIVRLDDDYQR